MARAREGVGCKTVIPFCPQMSAAPKSLGGEVTTAEMDRVEYLAWAKACALDYLDRGELANAIASVGSDLQKHSAWKDSEMVAMLTYDALVFEMSNGSEAIRRWIKGFRC